jgi:hypothetical protein
MPKSNPLAAGETKLCTLRSKEGKELDSGLTSSAVESRRMTSFQRKASKRKAARRRLFFEHSH